MLLAFIVVMSGLVDIWTNEMSKLREKEKLQIQSIHSTASTQHETSQPKNNTSTGILASTVQFFKPRLLFSEASLSMLVECFNP